MEHSDSARKSPPSVLTLSEPFSISDELSRDDGAGADSAGADATAHRFSRLFIRWLAEPIPDVSVDWCLENVLTELERADYTNKFSNEGARFDWLLGRLCAKEAVRELVFNLHDVLIPSSEIEIRTADDGSPHVFFVGDSAGEAVSVLENTTHISITHSAKRAYVLSITTDGKERPGIDCEKLRDVESGMTELVFESNERKFIEAQSSDSDQSKAFFRLWTAREAVLKALNSTAKKPFDLVAVHSDRFSIAVPFSSKEDVVVSGIHERYAVSFCVIGR